MSSHGEGLGPISIKHGSLTILIYDTPTIIFSPIFNFIELTLNRNKKRDAAKCNVSIATIGYLYFF